MTQVSDYKTKTTNRISDPELVWDYQNFTERKKKWKKLFTFYFFSSKGKMQLLSVTFTLQKQYPQYPVSISYSGVHPKALGLGFENFNPIKNYIPVWDAKIKSQFRIQIYIPVWDGNSLAR